MKNKTPKEIYDFFFDENSIVNKDMDLTRLFGIPTSTLQDWKNRDDDNWRKKLYDFLKKSDIS